MEFDRSRFVDREVLDPHHVMEQSTSSAGAVGAHTEGNLDFLKQAVDLGVRVQRSEHPAHAHARRARPSGQIPTPPAA